MVLPQNVGVEAFELKFPEKAAWSASRPNQYFRFIQNMLYICPLNSQRKRAEERPFCSRFKSET
jgi:hypothetical protein